MSDDLEERGSRLEQAMFGPQQESEETQETQETEESQSGGEAVAESDDADQETTPLVEETHDLHMYLPEQRYQDLMGLYKALDGEYYREHGADLEKNRQYFDAVIAVALDHEEEVRNRLDL